MSDYYGECRFDCEAFIRTVEFGFLVGFCEKVGGIWWHIFNPIFISRTDDIKRLWTPWL